MYGASGTTGRDTGVCLPSNVAWARPPGSGPDCCLANLHAKPTYPLCQLLWSRPCASKTCTSKPVGVSWSPEWRAPIQPFAAGGLFKRSYLLDRWATHGCVCDLRGGHSGQEWTRVSVVPLDVEGEALYLSQGAMGLSAMEARQPVYQPIGRTVRSGTHARQPMQRLC